MTSSALDAGLRPRRIAIVYDNTLRPDTTGEYCRRALELLGMAVTHYLPQDAETIPPIYELYLRVDDDLEYALPAALRPVAYWAIDTHRDYDARLARARAADVVCCAQRNGAARMRADGLAAHWLPLACDPSIHRRLPGVAKATDLCFVGNTFPGDGERSRRVAWIRGRYPRSVVGQAYGEEMARIYTASRLVFNCAIRDDINMRVFEAVACGSLLVTNDLADNGQTHLFTPGEHLATYRDDAELAEVVERFLADETARERIAAAGMRHAQTQHTYERRMRDLLGVALAGTSLEAVYPVSQGRSTPSPAHPIPDAPICPVSDTRIRPVPDAPTHPRVAAPARPPAGAPTGRPVASIIIPAYNRLDQTQQCVAYLRAHTDLPYEILLVDNGSTDETGAWGRREGLRVIANPENRGFPTACNQGLLAADGDYAVLLNNDAYVSPGWLGRLVAHAAADESLGLVGPSSNFACSLQQVPTTYRTPEEWLAFAAELAERAAGQGQDVTRLVGLCLLIPRAVVQQVGLLDPRFGLGLFEDDDYCLRVRLAGYRLRWAQDVFVHHEGHQTFRALAEAEYRQRLQENRQRFLTKWSVGPLLAEWEAESALVARLQDGGADGWDLLRGGRYAEAYAGFEAAARSAPENLRNLLGLGLSAEGRGVPQAAAIAYQAILARAPDDPEARRGLARVRGGAPVMGTPR
jgi:GT2 family glycosyltransferase